MNPVADRLRNISQIISLADINESSDELSTASDITKNVLAQKMCVLKERELDDGVDKTLYFSRNEQIREKAQDTIAKANVPLRHMDDINSRKMMFVRHELTQYTNDTIFNDDSKKGSINSLTPIELREYTTTLFNSSNECETFKKFERAHLDRFGIPFSMIAKAHRHHRNKTVQENVLRRVRLSHMCFNQPPLSENSSADDSMQNVKRLALVRTPYFLIPTIRNKNASRNAGFQNRYLQKERLRRINLFFRQYKKMGSIIDDNKLGANKLKFHAPTNEQCEKKLSKTNFFEEKIISIIRLNFKRLFRICEPCVIVIYLYTKKMFLTFKFKGFYD